MVSKLAYLIDLLIIPLTMLSYYCSLVITSSLQLNVIYFYFLLFVMLHTFSSLLILFSNYVVYGKINVSLMQLGFGPTIGAFIALILVSVMPFLKWPLYIFKWMPNFDFWITPMIMGFSALFVQIFLRKTVNESIIDPN